MGKRQLGELDVSELVSTLLISEIASIPIDDPDIPLMNAIIPILFILAIEILLSTIKNKSEKLKGVIEGKPQYIIYKGRLLQNVLDENRISINELLSEMRTQGVGDIEEIYYAAIEQNGSLSILKKNDSQMAHTIIIDGNVIESNLKALGYNEEWLKKHLKESKAKQDEVFLMTVDDGGKINLIRKENL
jgi:uncharacterized membrane protein YcaP (DUF421 family)